MDQINNESRYGFYTSNTDRKKVAPAITASSGDWWLFTIARYTTLYNYIVGETAPPQTKFETIVPPGWKTIALNNLLSPSNQTDTDGDNLTDWQEVDTEKVTWDNSGKAIPPICILL